MLSITLFVDDSASAGGDGLAWATAYNDLQSALTQAAALNADATPTNDVDSIWIAEGTYKPHNYPNSEYARYSCFSLVNKVTLYGGFAGTENSLTQRNLSIHITTLSLVTFGIVGNMADNVFNVVYCGINIEAAIDGVSITGGNANVITDSTYHPTHP